MLDISKRVKRALGLLGFSFYSHIISIGESVRAMKRTFETD